MWFEDINWYHGKLSRDSAENLLLNDVTNDNGTFLVRDSNSSEGDFVLSILYNNQVYHYQILKADEDAFFFIDSETAIHGLDTLVEYYRDDAHGLVTKLTKCCPGSNPPPKTRRNGHTNLLHRATKVGDYRVVYEILKDKEKNVEAKNDDGQTAMHLAARIGNNDILCKLIETGATTNCRDTTGYTPLHYACQVNKPSTVEILVTLGSANIQARNPETSWVPLHEAASRGFCDVVKTLLLLNAPKRPRTDENETPEELAIKNGHVECAKLIREYRVPSSSMTRDAYYHGTLDRDEAVKLLRKQPDGTFLVRYSDRNGGSFVLTLKHDSSTFHYIISEANCHFCIDNGPYFDSLEQMIQFYTLMADGLPTILKFPLLPKPKPPVPTFDTLPRRKTPRWGIDLDKTRHDIEKLTEKFEMHVADATMTSGQVDHGSSHSAVPGSSNSMCGATFQFKYEEPDCRVVDNRVVPEPVQENMWDSMDFNRTDPYISDILLNAKTYDFPVLQSPSILECMLKKCYGEVQCHKDEEIIVRDDIKLIEVIGAGEFGSVYKAVYVENSGDESIVAVKELHQSQSDSIYDQFMREAKLMMKLRHPYIIRLIGVVLSPSLMMVQEYVELGSLLTYLSTHAHMISPDFELKLWAAQIAAGMCYLESQKFVHRDLAARNILLAAKNVAKISDFGMSRALNVDKDYYRASEGGKWPVRWYAPESYNYGHFTAASDVWSYGVLIWEMFSYGEQPYGSLKGLQVIDLIERGERLSQPIKCPDNVYRLMLQCWSYDVSNRPTFDELREFFASDSNYQNLTDFVREDVVV